MPKKHQNKRPSPLRRNKSTRDDFKKYEDSLLNLITITTTAQSYMNNASCLVNNVMCQIQPMPSKIDALIYKLDDIQRTMMNIQGNMGSLQHMNVHIEPVIRQVSEFSTSLNKEFVELHEKIKNMDMIVNGLDGIAKDPVINRTIEELQEIAGRIEV